MQSKYGTYPEKGCGIKKCAWATRPARFVINKPLDKRLNSLVEPAKEIQKDMIMAKQPPQKSSLEKVNRKQFSPYLTILKMTRYPMAFQVCRR